MITSKFNTEALQAVDCRNPDADVPVPTDIPTGSADEMEVGEMAGISDAY